MINHLIRVSKINKIIGNPLSDSFLHFKAKNKPFKKDCIFYYSKKFNFDKHTTQLITFYYFNNISSSVFEIGHIQYDLVNKSNKNVFTEYSERSDIDITFINEPSYCINNEMFNELSISKNISLKDAKCFLIGLFTNQYIKELKFLLEHSYLS